MTILGIDSSTQVCSAAVMKDGALIAERYEKTPQRHAELLLSFVDEVVAEAEVFPKNLDVVAVSIGPGSFTGLRIGLSVAKGIATGMNIPIIPVPSMDTVAYKVFYRDEVPTEASVLVPARRSEYYYGRYRRTGGKPEMLTGIQVYKTKDLCVVLERYLQDTLAGEGLGRFVEEIQNKSDGQYGTLTSKIQVSLDKNFHIITAGYTCLLSGYYGKAELSSIEPLYIKRFESGSENRNK
jgi:tRNA threonylcarbamoyladenosine biosynthesis protein TsaB